MEGYYKTIETVGFAEFKDRGSRFLAFAYPIATPEDFKKHLQALKKDHPKAVHHCFAFRLGLTGNEYRSSDDGEPSGTAGRPILGQIDSKGLTDMAIVVVRYFGGTLLGVPGLINAYKTSASLVLQVLPAVFKPILVFFELEFDYTNLNTVMHTLKMFNVQVKEEHMTLFCKMKIGVPETAKAAFLNEISRHYSISCKIC